MYELELVLSEVNNRTTIAAIEANNDTYCLEKRIEKFPLIPAVVTIEINWSSLVYQLTKLLKNIIVHLYGCN